MAIARRAALGSLALGATGYGWVRYAEPRWFEVTDRPVPAPRFLASGQPPVRLLHISDLHVSDGMTAEELSVGLEAGLATRPDLICLTGDFVTTNKGFDKAGLVRLLRRAASVAPTYAVLGNHDGGSWLARRQGDPSTRIVGDLLRHSGVQLLENQHVVHPLASGQRLHLVGVADLWSGKFHPQAATRNLLPSHGAVNHLATTHQTTTHAKPPYSATEPLIILCHNPDGKAAFRHLAWDLFLSGHTHGGQGRIPGLTPYWVPTQDKRFISGLYPYGPGFLHITRGLGSPKHVRAFCRPELSLLRLGATA